MGELKTQDDLFKFLKMIGVKQVDIDVVEEIVGEIITDHRRDAWQDGYDTAEETWAKEESGL